MRLLTTAVLATALLVLPSHSAMATIINLSANMDCSQANAGAGTCGAGGTGSGTATITLDDATNLLSWNIAWSGLSGATTAAHFHGPALANQNAGVQVGFLSIAPGNPSIGSTTISAGQAADLLNELWYVNIHSSTFGGGEIRGQVLIPEPATALLVALGGVGLGVAGRRRRLTG